MIPSRRGVLTCGAAALASISLLPAAAARGAGGRLAVPFGCAVSSRQLAEPVFAQAITTHFDRLTPEFEMKMNFIAQAPGRYRFDEADRIAEFARANTLRLHGHTLVWYKQEPAVFRKLDGNRRAFEEAYRAYIELVVKRYRGTAQSWDVVNEPIAPEGGRLRDCLWGRNLGTEDYVLLAFQMARAADPDARLLINEYDLELRPEKRRAFLGLVERLLKRGAPIDGIGNQAHIRNGITEAQIKACFDDLKALGLPVHISELDVSFGFRTVETRTPEALREAQRAVLTTFATAFAALPKSQKFGFTVWGLRDRDSWLQSPEMRRVGFQEPLLFDDELRPKSLFDIVSRILG